MVITFNDKMRIKKDTTCYKVQELKDGAWNTIAYYTDVKRAVERAFDISLGHSTKVVMLEQLNEFIEASIERFLKKAEVTYES